MRKRKQIEWLAVMLACPLAAVHAGGKSQIIKFDVKKVEVREGSQYRFVDANTLGRPPIPIEQRDERNFLLIKANGKMVWVNAGDVQTDELKNLRHNCSQLAMSERPDRREYGPRGAGEGCK